MVAVAIWVPWGVIAPAYARPATVAILPPSAEPLQATFGDAIQLVGYDSPRPTVTVGHQVPLTLFWRSQKPLDQDYTLFVHLLDETDLVIAQRNLFHGSGLYPTSQWSVGEQFADSYLLRVPRTAYAPAQAQFEVGLYDHTTGRRVPLSSGADSLRFGLIELQPQPGDLPNPQLLQFEDNISLRGYLMDRRLITAGETLTLTLYWQSSDAPSGDYKVFVHLVSEAGTRVAQHDTEPQGGAAPTSGWNPGRVIMDVHPLTTTPETPAGAYRLIIGLYQEETGRRLRLLYSDGQPVQTDSVILPGVRIVAAP
jgi:hypothetical protein